jgi:hypothetical protein
VLKAVAGLVPPHPQDNEEEEQEQEQQQGAAWPGGGSQQSLGPQQAAMLDKRMERLKQGKEVVNDEDEIRKEQVTVCMYVYMCVYGCMYACVYIRVYVCT